MEDHECGLMVHDGSATCLWNDINEDVEVLMGVMISIMILVTVEKRKMRIWKTASDADNKDKDELQEEGKYSSSI